MLFGNGTTLGLDLGATGIRGVELVSRAGRPALDRWAASDFPAEVADWRNIDAQQMAQTLRALTVERGFRSTWVAHAVSGESVAPQYFNFPQLMREDVAEAVRIEVETALPFRVEDALVSYVLFPDQKAAGGKVRTHGLAIAADGALVESRLAAIRLANFEPFCVETDSTACANAFLSTRSLAQGGTTAILNIGQRHTNLALLGGEGTLLVRDLPWAGASVTQAVADQLKVNPIEAEKVKRQDWAEGRTGPLSARRQELLEGNARDFAVRLRDTIEYWVSERLVPALGRVYITGGGSQVHGLPEFLAAVLAVPVERWSPLEDIGAASEELKPWTYRMTVAFGLALRKFERERR
jgi:type IV pilus assembly protein PilM